MVFMLRIQSYDLIAAAARPVGSMQERFLGVPYRAGHGLYFMLTSVRSTNHDCGDTKPCTFFDMARGLRSWTM